MRPRTLIVLLALVLALGAFVWFFERDLPGSEDRAEQAKRVLRGEAEEVTAVDWTRDGVGIRLERSDDDVWRLSKPLEARAAAAAAERLAELLVGLIKERTLEDATATEVGLDEPEAEVSVEFGDRRERLLVGPRLPASDSRIASAGEEGPIWIVANEFWAELERPLDDWRSRDVWTGTADRVERVVFEPGAESVVLGRRDGDFWLEAPIEDRADPGTVSRFLGSLASLEVSEFVDRPAGELDALGLAEPRATVELIDDTGALWRLEIGDRVPQDKAPSPIEDDDASRVYARAEDQIYVLSDPLSEAVERSVEEWRSYEWATRQVFEIERLIATDESGEIDLVRDSGDWLRDGEAIEFAVVSDLLYAITSSKAEALDAPAPAGEPLLAFTINPGEEEERLEIFAPTADRHPARTGGREALLWLGGDRVRDLRSKLEAVRTAVAQEAQGAADESGDPNGSEE